MNTLIFYTARPQKAQGATCSAYQSLTLVERLALGSRRTSNDLDELTGNDGLTRSVVQNLELVDHLARILGSIVHGVLARRLLASMALSQRPEERVGKSVLAEVGEHLVLNLERREVG